MEDRKQQIVQKLKEKTSVSFQLHEVELRNETTVNDSDWKSILCSFLSTVNVNVVSSSSVRLV